MKSSPESIPDALENLSRVMEHADSLWGFDAVNKAVFKALALMAERIEKLEARSLNKSSNEKNLRAALCKIKEALEGVKGIGDEKYWGVFLDAKHDVRPSYIFPVLCQIIQSILPDEEDQCNQKT